MSVRGKLGAAGISVGVAVAGGAIGVARHRSVIRRNAGETVELGALHSEPRMLVTPDGVDLQLEVDERDPRLAEDDRPTLVFVHGYTLNMDSFHFQRATFRGHYKMVFYDQRSHGRSGRSPLGSATIEQLGDDLAQLLREVVPGERVILVGHSMGGMTMVSLAERHPDLFEEQVVGAALLATSAGGLKVHRSLLPVLPSIVGGELLGRGIATLSRAPRGVDWVRDTGAPLADAAISYYAFGGNVPPAYRIFTSQMIAQTPFEVVAEFFPMFAALDKFGFVEEFSRVPTIVICGTKDKLTPISHSRKLASLIDGAELVEAPGSGHMVLMEAHATVNAALERLIDRVADRAGSGARPARRKRSAS